MATPTELRVREWHISGAELATVTRRGDTLWTSGVRSAARVATAEPPPRTAAAAPPTAPAHRDTMRLDAVVVRAMRTEFEERRLSGLGQYLTRMDLDKERARALPDILSQLPGVRIARDAGKAWVTSGRGVVTGLNERRQITPRFRRDPLTACYADVYLDGMLVYGGKKDETFFDVSAISPVVLEGVEYYASPARTPAKYSRPGAACGTLLLWTRMH